MKKYFTIDNFDFSGKVVGVRVDINSPLIDSKIKMSERIISSCRTIKELSLKGAKVVVLAHQGRKGKKDFVSLKNHKFLIEERLSKKIKFSEEIYSKNLVENIKKLKSGEIILLENLRFFDDETNLELKKNKIVELSKVFDYYVFDAFSVAHRAQTSVNGINLVPLVAGRTMEKELVNLYKIENAKSPRVFVFGGAKPDDLIVLIEKALKDKSVDKIFLTGVIGELALKINGNYLGKKLEFLKENDCLVMEKNFAKLLKKYSSKFELPLDVAFFDGKKRVEIKVGDMNKKKDLLDKFSIQDVGALTVKDFSKKLNGAGSIYFKGPAGNFELKEFKFGTKELIKSIVSTTTAFTFMGGGHSVTAAKMFGCLDKFSYVSQAGGALVHFLSGEKLPGIVVLEESFEKFENKQLDFVVVGSNTLDIKVDVPEKLSEFMIGDKVRVDDNFKFSSGGGGVNASIVLSKLGAHVAYLGKVSYENRQRLVDDLKENEIVFLESKETRIACAKSILLQTKDRDRIIFTYRGQNPYLEMDDFDFGKLKSNNFYFNSLSGKSFETLVKLAAKIKKTNKSSVICFNLSSHLIENEKNLSKLLKNVDILIYNFDESKMLTGKDSLSACLVESSNYGPKLVIITDGANGSYAYKNGKFYDVKSLKVKKVVDTTGAGDCFASTFFYFYAKNYGIKNAMKYASINSAHLIMRNGAQKGSLDFDDLVREFKK